MKDKKQKTKAGRIELHEESLLSTDKENLSYLNSIGSNDYSIHTTSKTLSNEFQLTSVFQDESDENAPAQKESTYEEFGTKEVKMLATAQQDERNLDWTDSNLLEKTPINSVISALKHDGFDSFLTLVRACASSLKKSTLGSLVKIMKSIPVDDLALTKCTTDPLRNLRYAATFLCYELLKMKIKAKESAEYLFEEVLIKRYKDVDPNIRSLCVSSLIDTLVLCPALFDASHFDIFSRSIVDKNEAVRRKSIKALKKLMMLKNTTSLKAFYLKNLKVVNELSLFDRSESVRRECANLLFLLYNNDVVKKEACFKVLHLADQRAFDSIVDEIKTDLRKSSRAKNKEPSENVLFPISTLHELLDINEKSLSLLKFTQENLNEFIERIMGDLSCDTSCKKGFSCKLKILSVIALPNTPLKYFIEMLEMVKENPLNISLVLATLMRLNLKAEYEETDEIMKITYNLNKNFKNRFLDTFLKLLKQINGAISSYYIDLILNESTCVDVAKYFDISYFECRNVLFQCYSFLWRAINKDFRDVHLEGGFNEDLEALFNFLIFFKEKANEPSGIKSSIAVFYNKLEEYVREYLRKKKLSSRELDELHKLVKRGILPDTAYLFKKDIIKERCLEEFFGKLLETRKLDKTLAKKVSKETKGCSAFDYLKSCAGNELEEVLEYFVSGLSQNEAIYLENKCRTKKVKSQLLRKINTKKKVDFPRSPVRENEDVVSL